MCTTVHPVLPSHTFLPPPLLPQEKFNVWVALLNLENTYGQPPEEAAASLLARALQYSDQKKMYLAALAVFQRTPGREEQVGAGGRCDSFVVEGSCGGLEGLKLLLVVVMVLGCWQHVCMILLASVHSSAAAACRHGSWHPLC